MLGLKMRCEIACLSILIGCTVAIFGTVGVTAQEFSTQMPRPTLSQGDRDSAVSELQAVLKLLGYYNGAIDGEFSSETTAAVIRFQQAAGLTADGIVGAQTWNRLFPTVTGTSSTLETPSTFPVLRRGMEGEAVIQLQERLQVLGFYTGGLDGVFGEQTEAAAIAAQQSFGLEPDGIVGKMTWDALFQTSP